MKNAAVSREEDRNLLPVCRISGDDSTVNLQIELPGVPKNAIDIRLDGDRLVITGRRPEEKTEGRWLLRERLQGSYERSFTIDHSIDRDRIEAHYEHGVMNLTLYVKDEVKPRRIEIAG